MENEIKYYNIKHLGQLVNADHPSVIHMLFCMEILEINDNPDTVPKYGNLAATVQFRRREKELYAKFFKDYFYFKDGTSHYDLLITNEFIEFVKDRIEKVGELYNVHFN